MSLVSVVIPTRHRPQLVLRAIHSVLNQTYSEIELIVVIDGPDATTTAAMGSIEDPRLQYIVNPRSLTAAGARNVGAARATGDWIAFLDDDDEWLPNKLERQMAFASATTLVSCLSRVVTPLATYVWPRTVYDNSMPLDEYLFDRRSLFLGSGFIQTSSYLLPRRLFDQVRFNVESPHDDWELVLRLCKETGAKIRTVPEVLVTLYFEEERSSLSNSGAWSASLRWIESIRPIITPRAYSGFCLGVVGSRAAKEGAYAAFPDLLQAAFRHGSPTLWHVTFYLAFWIAPQGIRRRLRALFRGQPG
ncbi:MAG TPA: glycosyltransferase family 2 protein [Bradyrhizobium sp.]|nr:glycosyltransferase family 2 protein [Bradyrhizobium sp.]